MPKLRVHYVHEHEVSDQLLDEPFAELLDAQKIFVGSTDGVGVRLRSVVTGETKADLLAAMLVGWGSP